MGTIDKIKQAISEAFDSETEIVWKKDNSGWVGYFAIDGVRYKMNMELDDEKVDNFNVWMFKFFYWNGTRWSTELTKNNKPFSVFGAIRKGIFEFFDEVKPDVFLFIGDEYRDSLYKKLYTILAMQKHYGFLDDIKRFVYLLMSDNVHAKTIEKLKEKVMLF
jgi:hypothetical protein